MKPILLKVKKRKTMPKTKRSPKIKKQSAEESKTNKALKTALPLVVTMLLLIVLYVLVLVPKKPENELKKAFFNTFDSTKQKSGRYDGTIGIEEGGIKIEFNGQKASNGDTSSSYKLTQKDNTITLENANVSNDSYIKFDGVGNIPTLIESIPGAKSLEPSAVVILDAVNGKWVSLNNKEKQVVSGETKCVAELENLSFDTSNGDVENNFPFEITAGPFIADDGSVTQSYEVKLRKDRNVSSSEAKLTALVDCVDSLRGDDYRLRRVGESDMDAIRLSLTVDPLSNTINHIIYKSFGNYFQLFLRDFNKDITVSAPENSVSMTEIISGLPTETKLQLLLSQNQ